MLVPQPLPSQHRAPSLEDPGFNNSAHRTQANRHHALDVLLQSVQESTEVTLKTDVESGASGYSVTGGGDQGIFVKQVLKDSSAAKLFDLREGTTAVLPLGLRHQHQHGRGKQRNMEGVNLT